MIERAALVRLKETEECFVDLPETLFDLDFPGQYLRRIKSMNLTIPCVTGPYTGVHATLTLVQNSVRRSNTIGSDYGRMVNDDPRFADSLGAIQSIATSTGQNDSGLFEVNFGDARYLPFEGAGAISQWRIELPNGSNQFDFNMIADVLLQLKYPVRESGEALRAGARAALGTSSGDLARLFSMKHEFPMEWHRFLHPPEAQTNQSVDLDLTQDRFPFQFQSKTINVNKVELFLKVNNTLTYTTLNLFFQPTQATLPVSGEEYALMKDTIINNLPHGMKSFAPSNTNLGSWTLLAKDGDIAATSLSLPVSPSLNPPAPARLNPEAIEDLWILCHYEVT